MKPRPINTYIMFYFIRKIVFNGSVGVEYIKNPTKVLELNLTIDQQRQLQNYLTTSQQIRYKMLTEFEEKTIIPPRFFSNNDNLRYGFACFGFKNIYDYLERIYHSSLNKDLERLLKASSLILNWEISDLQVVESDPQDLNYKSIELLWLRAYPIGPVVPENSLLVKF